jgi:hypothetical protein
MLFIFSMLPSVVSKHNYASALLSSISLISVQTILPNSHYVYRKQHKKSNNNNKECRLRAQLKGNLNHLI